WIAWKCLFCRLTVWLACELASCSTGFARELGNAMSEQLKGHQQDDEYGYQLRQGEAFVEQHADDGSAEHEQHKDAEQQLEYSREEWATHDGICGIGIWHARSGA